MSYTPHTWQTGETVTAEKLNAMEQGIAGGGGVLLATFSNNTLDVTWQDIYNAGFAVIYMEPSIPDDLYIMYTTRITIYGGAYTVGFYNPEMGDMMFFSSNSPTGLLTLES